MGECLFWYRPTRVVPDQRPLNGCCCCCCCCRVCIVTNRSREFEAEKLTCCRREWAVMSLITVTPHPIRQRSILMSVSVCLCVCLSVRKTTCPIFARIFVRVTYGRGSVLLWRRSDALCNSGFMDDVIFAHKPRLLDVAAQMKRSARAALGLAINRAH